MAQNKKDNQHTKYIITQNNPDKYKIDEYKILEILGEMGQKLSLVYACFAKEIGNEEHTPHYHIFLNFSSKTRFSAVQQRFNFAHIEAANGSVEQNIAYVEKNGIWAESEKHSTIIEGSFKEWGTRPEKKAKKRNPATDLYRNLIPYIEAGFSNSELYHIDPHYVKFSLDKIREDILSEEFKGKIREELCVTYMYGCTGTGKTTEVHNIENLFWISTYSHPFDKYFYQNTIAFDEFRDSIKIADMLKILDKFPVELEARYSDRTAAFENVYIISNWSLVDQYKNAKKVDLEAFYRRIHKVQVYQKIFNSHNQYYVRVLEFSCKDYLKNPNIPLEFPVEQVGTTADKFFKNIIKINKNPDFVEESSDVLNDFECCQQSIFN